MISKIARVVLGLVFIGSSVFAQSLADAKKAIDAEQYQKAKGMLKNLTVTQPTNDENFFYLGWVYILQDYADSAKTSFTKGIAANPKSALNYVGLGVVAHVNKDQAGTTSNFNQAITLTPKKDSKPYLYIGKGYMIGGADGKVPANDANAAIDALNKGKVANPKDAEVLLELGNAYRSQLKSNEAYTNYSAALALDPKSPAANTAEGVLWRYAENYEDSQKQFQAAIAIDPNFGPAYREWAEMDKDWALSNRSVASAKIKEATENYKKYLSLTDQSVESLMRYSDFLINAGEYKTLQEVATTLSKGANSNARIYRYLGYAAYENKDYPAGLTALNTWFQKADPKRVIPRDYLYLGRLQIASGQDSLGVMSLRKAATLDTTQADIYLEIAKSYYGKKKYVDAANSYQEYFNKSHKGTLTEYFNQGRSYYFAYQDQYFSKATPKPTPDSTLLVKADSAFSHIQQKATTPVADIEIYRARTNDYKETDRNAIKGYAKPFYERYIALITTKGGTPDDRTKTNLIEAYDYLGAFYAFAQKDDAKATENFNKAKELDPADKQAAAYFARKTGAGKSK